MNPRQMYNELMFTSLLLNVFDALISAGTVFSIIFLFVYFNRIPVYIAIICALAMFGYSIYNKIKKNKILLLEKKYPDLRERLRTSFDNKRKANLVLNELHADVTAMMKKVDINAFLDGYRLSMKIITICLVMSSILFLSSVGFDIIDIQRGITSSGFYRIASTTIDKALSTPDEVEPEYLDEEREIKLGEKEKKISIETFNTELDISQIEQNKKNEFGGHFPEEIAAVAQQTYDAKIPQEHKEVVKKYFEKIHND